MRVIIHTGHLSVDNGAVGPLTQYFDLARLLGIPANPGAHYGDDELDIPDESWPIAESLLQEAKLVYRVPGQHDVWQNIHMTAGTPLTVNCAIETSLYLAGQPN